MKLSAFINHFDLLDFKVLVFIAFSIANKKLVTLEKKTPVSMKQDALAVEILSPSTRS